MTDVPPKNAEQVDRAMAVLERGVVEIYSRDELAARLTRSYTTDRPMRVKLGMDPTAPDIHLGHTVVLRKMRQFQDLGHKAVLIIGDYTARVGDPSGQNKTRPVLSGEDIDRNARTYLDQAGKVLDLSPEKLEVRRNSEWLGGLSFADVITLTSKMTVARMLERDTFDIRYKAGDPIGIHEFLYPLMQGYDSMMIEADVELGGTDQTFNNLVGRDLQRDAGQAPQIVMIMPILVGLDGTEKMSKSKGNYIGVTDAPADMFGKVMSISDDLMRNYYELLTTVPADEITRLTGSDVHPREAKGHLASTIVETFYDAEAAKAAAEDFQRRFSRREAPKEWPVWEAPEGTAEGKHQVASLMRDMGVAGSASEARNLIKGGGVKIDGEPFKDPGGTYEFVDGTQVQLTKRKFGMVRFTPAADYAPPTSEESGPDLYTPEQDDESE
jgi:tyrosyl-tRNA synthetase